MVPKTGQSGLRLTAVRQSSPQIRGTNIKYA